MRLLNDLSIKVTNRLFVCVYSCDRDNRESRPRALAGDSKADSAVSVMLGGRGWGTVIKANIE